jgi:hypothetical protein
VTDLEAELRMSLNDAADQVVVSDDALHTYLFRRRVQHVEPRQVGVGHALLAVIARLASAVVRSDRS